MGATCSSCCWSDRRASDVLHDDDDALRVKLLDPATDEYDCHSTTVEDSVGNPYRRSLDLRAKEAWPRPLATPPSEYAGGYDDTERSGYATDDRSSPRSGSSTSSSPLNHAWNLREPGSHADASFVDVQALDDSAGFSTRDRAPLSLDRTLRASESARSSASDSYASNRELPTYESFLFADDAQKSSPKATSQGSGDLADDGDDDDEDATSDRD